MLLERREKTEAIDILHFKIARGMKKLLIFNCFWRETRTIFNR